MEGPLAWNRERWLERVQRSRELLPKTLLDTPLLHRSELDEAVGCKLYLKNEGLGPVRSFKSRGTELLFQLRNLSGPVVCASAGNFGQGVAWSASSRGIRSIVFAAEGASPLKVQRMRKLGADVRLVGNDLDAAKEVARQEADAAGWTFVEDGRDEEMFLGAATIGFELEDNGPSFDLLLCPVGNGALFGGVGGWLALRGHPATRVGVVATAAPSMAKSFLSGNCISTASAQTIADGIAVRTPVPQGVERVNAFADDVVSVSEESLAAAVRLLAEATGLIVEPAGAAGVAALLEHGSRWRGLRVVTPLCGSNLDPDRLAVILGSNTAEPGTQRPGI